MNLTNNYILKINEIYKKITVLTITKNLNYFRSFNQQIAYLYIYFNMYNKF